MAIEKIDIRDSDPEFKRFKNKLKDNPRHVDIGIFGAKSGSDMVQKASQNEFGTERIPERSFIRAGIDKHKVAYIKFMKKAAANIAAGVASKKTALMLLGAKAKGDIQTYIDIGKFEPNAPFTIAKKGSSKPLIDTGRMRQSVDYAVEK